MKFKNSSGNVLWIILIGIALFAGLAYAVSLSGRSSGNLSREQKRLMAIEIIQYATAIKSAVNRLVVYGASDTALRFASPGANAAYGVFGTTPTAEVFNVSGGAAAWQNPPAGSNDGTPYEFMGHLKITGNGTDSGAAASAELTLNLFAVDPDLCSRLNDELGHVFASVPVDAGTVTLTRFAGTYTNGDVVDGTSSELVRKTGFCFREQGGSQRYIFTYVLRAR